MNPEKIGLVVGVLVFLFCIVVGGIVGNVDYRYEVDKCKDMTKGENVFEFDKEIQLNARYDSHCRYINLHPFAQPGHILLGSILGLVLGFLIGGLVGLLFFKIAEWAEDDNDDYY